MQLFNHVQFWGLYSSWQGRVLPILNHKHTIAVIAASIFTLAYGLICRTTKLNKMRAELLNKNDQALTHQNETVHALKDQALQSAPASEHPSSLKFGYMAIPFLEEKDTQKLFQALEDFYSKPEDYQKQFAVPDEVEIGFATAPGKKCFVIRNQQLPDELKIFIDYIPKVHAKALAILSEIESQMGYSPGQLTHTVSKTPLPVTGKAASLLRLFVYDPSETAELGANLHEDLGLLTLIPRSPVAGLEVLDYSKENPALVKLESEAQPSEATVLVGETLQCMTKGHYLPATHQVTRGPQKRYSIVYQLRAEPETKIFEGGKEMTVEDWLKKQKTFRQSINNTY